MNDKILIKPKGNNSWAKITQSNYPNEAYLQELIYKDPNIIPLKDIGEEVPALKVIIREAGLPGSGYTDLIGIDEDGQITIIECKLAKNPEVKREVIGQVLEYAAFLWHKLYDDFDQIVRDKLGKTLIEAMQERIDFEEWSPEEFIKNVSNNLEKGIFRLIIAVDIINDELKRTVQYLNTHSSDSFEFYLLELNYFSNDNQEIIVPSLFGVIEKSRFTSTRRSWTEEEVIEDCKKNNSAEVYLKFIEIHEFGKNNNFFIKMGTGKQTGTFTYYFLKGKEKISVFALSSVGNITLNLGVLYFYKIPEDNLRQFVNEINKIEGLQISNDFNKFPTIKIDPYLIEDAHISIFKDAIINLNTNLSKVKGDAT